MLLTAHIVPAMFAVSTHTGEGGRLLYFPGIFLCAIIAFALLSINKKTVRYIITASVFCYFCFFLKRDNHSWVRADKAIDSIISHFKTHTYRDEVYVVNIPRAIDGAFIYGNGFKESLAINDLDASHIVVVNYLLNEDAMQLPVPARHQLINHTDYNIPPFVRVNNSMITATNTNVLDHPDTTIVRKPGSVVLYWNQIKMVTLP